jgi:hypothetical protein
LASVSAVADSWVMAMSKGWGVGSARLRMSAPSATLDSEARGLLQRGMALAMEWARQGLVIPHISQTIDSTVEAIKAGLRSLKAGRGTLGQVAVIVDLDLAAGK